MDVVKADLDGDTDNDGTISHNDEEDAAEDEAPGMVVFVADDSRPASEWRRPITLTVTRRACRITWTKSSENFLLYADESCTNTTLPTTIAPGATVTIYAKGVSGSNAAGGDWLKADCKPTGPVDGTNEIATDKILITVAQVDLVVDSNNSRGTLDPTPSADLEAIEENSPGKIVFVNHNDDDLDGVPDYADREVAGEQNFVPLLVRIQPRIGAWSSSLDAQVTFTYAGGAALPAMAGADIGNDYRDYREAKTGTVRLWDVATPASFRSPPIYIEPNHPYSPILLGFNHSNTRRFFIEGINQAANSDILVRFRLGPLEMTDTVRLTVVEPNLGINGNNDLVNNDGMRVGTPDVDFVIDGDDEVIEDQKEMVFWSNRASGNAREDPFTMETLDDFLPLLVEVPALALSAGYEAHLEFSSPSESAAVTLGVVRATSPATNRRAFLQTVDDAAAQLANPVEYIRRDQLFALPGVVPGPNEFLVTSLNQRADTAGSRLLKLVLVKPPDRIVADQVRVRFVPSTKMWTIVSLRESSGAVYIYPTEDGRTVPVNSYDVPTSYNHANRDPGKPHHLVMLHGYNVNYEAAINNFDVTYKRVFWLGFRGNFIGVTWVGEETQLFRSATPFFDPNVANAFQTSPAMLLFTRTYLQSWAHGFENVDFLAYSLGNLVMWDTLRLNARVAGAGPLVRNAISVEAAVWSEAFDEEGVESYPSPPHDPPAIVYSVNQLKQHSWKFWLNQAGYPARSSVSGEVYNCYNVLDFAVNNAMRSNDWFMRKYRSTLPGGPPPLPPWVLPGFPPLPQRNWHYYRDRLERAPAVFRAPGGANDLATIVPSLMDPRNWSLYDVVPLPGSGLWMRGAATLRLPQGCRPNPIADYDYEATVGGWNPRAHADFKDLALPRVYKWFHEFLGTGATGPGSAIPIGQE